MTIEKTVICKAANALKNSNFVLVSTGAGISVESGIPPFRGPGGLWEKYNPDFFDIDNFYANPKACWQKIRELFYEGWGNFSPNAGHYTLAEMQKAGRVHSLVTQNIDCLHQKAGSENVVEFHGTLGRIVCTNPHCRRIYSASPELIRKDIPVCPECGKLLKPDVVFFGEAIPEYAMTTAFQDARRASAVIVIGTSGTVMPANAIPRIAKENGAKIIEINPIPSEFTASGITDILLQGPAAEVLPELWKEMQAENR